MQNYLRVRQLDTGHELSVTQTMYDFAPDAYEVIEDEKKPATDSGGNPLPPKFKTSVASAAAKKAVSGQKADSDKENSR